MRVIFMGSPRFAVPFLERLVLERYGIAAVYTQPDKPAGRGRRMVPSPVKQSAQALGLPVIQPVHLNNPEAIAEMAELKPDVIVITAYGQILPQAILDLPRFKCLNAHFSLLPKYRGATPVAAAILGGEEFTGVSIMLVEKRLDTGPVLARLSIPIAAGDNTGLLLFKLSQVGSRFLPDVLGRWLRSEIVPQVQNEVEATYFGSITKEAGEIDWHLTVVEIWRRVRAFYPWPGCYTAWQGKHLKIVEAVPLPGAGSVEVGRVIALESGPPGVDFGVVTGNGILGIMKVQLEGKQVLSAGEFLRGRRDFLGALLPS